MVASDSVSCCFDGHCLQVLYRRCPVSSGTPHPPIAIVGFVYLFCMIIVLLLIHGVLGCVFCKDADMKAFFAGTCGSFRFYLND